MKRRTFIQQTSALAGLSALAANQTQAQNSAPAEFPIIISTWNNVKANEAAWAMVQKTGRALDAVEAGALIPEADPNEITVGYGGLPDRDGHVTLDACIMDEKGNAGSVTFLEGIMHPISVARAVMEKTPHVMLSGAGALQFALSQGFKKQNLLTESSKKAWLKWKKESKYEPKVNIERHDTIGLLALGKKGEVSGACTTSGMAYKMHGRVGDSPVIGAAVFCDDEVGGACATGLGEFVLKTLGSFLIVELMRNGRTPQQACEEAIMRIVKRYNYKEFQIGYLAVNKQGEYGAYSIQKGFSYTLTKEGITKVYEADYYMK
ncbi:N(4)-(beta-N-acetylglucosaminyl)-L-asparaginase [Flectobacillus sp. BAB-3569]|uniref:N(4)-(beta-N-acetylglucosaminyl)-L-asparaginase n=1 Tax=Flectobacillus sp. BAB-3569 TaxID=1509483 RepID=UPI000BA4578C|nr:N(4)-(beta-N-acetylglucosaminyl)-L-asparaginase [Flectobacillus sp. BAB-3569]PAC28223.1 glycosylasparaginase [Flectobacillus sp. BAB-3569]